MRGSASKTALILSPCTHWMSEFAGEESFEIESAVHGTEVHSAIEVALTGGPQGEMSVEYGQPVLELVDSIESLYGCKSSRHVEVSMFASIDGAFGLTKRENDYGEVRNLGVQVFCGTADLILVLTENSGARKLVVIDWKSGSPMFARMQLLSLAALANKCFGIGDNLPDVRCLSVKVEPGLTTVGLDFTASKKELDAHLSAVLNKYRSGPSHPVVGGHCVEHFCPHRELCKGIKGYYFSYETTKDHNSLGDDALYRQIMAAKATEETAHKRRLHMLKIADTRGGLHTNDGLYTEASREVLRTASKDLVALAKSKGATDAEILACSKRVREPAGWKLKKGAPINA